MNGRRVGPFLQTLATAIEQSGGEPYILPQKLEYLKQASNSIDDKYILDKHLLEDPKTKLNDLIEKYNISSLRRVMFSEMLYNYDYPKPDGNKFFPNGPKSPNYEPYVNYLHSILELLDRKYENGFRGIPIQNQGAEINRRILEIVCNKYDISSVRYSFNPIPGRRSIRRGDPMDYPRMEKSMNSILTKKQKKRAKDYRKSVLRDEPQIGKDTRTLTKRVEDIMNKLYHYKYDIYGELPKLSRRWLRLPIQAKIQTNWELNQNQSNELINNSDYVFYPIQCFREARITKRAPAFYNQPSLIEYLSRSIPYNTELVVKDHPQRKGELSLSDIKHISKFSNFVSTSVSTHYLIKHSEGIICLNNTVGHEAIVHGKPVVSLGESFYDDLDFVINLDNIHNLSNQITLALNREGPSEEKILKYINGLYEISVDVEWGNTDTENISNILKSLNKLLHG